MRAFRWLSLIGLAALWTGCAGYKLGPSNGQSAGNRTVQVVPFGNKTMEPRLGDELTTEVRKLIQRDGTFHLATQGDGDIVVTGDITGYSRRGQNFSSADQSVALDYRLNLVAQVTARERSTGKVLFNQTVTGYTLVHVGPDLTTVELQSQPLLAEDLAKNLVALLADGAW